jgi:hypothetical protein
MLPISTVFSALLLMGTTNVSADELSPDTPLAELGSSQAQVAAGYGENMPEGEKLMEENLTD